MSARASKGQLGKERLLSVSDIAELAGIATASVQSFYHQGYLPQPDVTIGIERAKMHGWRRETIDPWLAAREERRRAREA